MTHVLNLLMFVRSRHLIMDVTSRVEQPGNTVRLLYAPFLSLDRTVRLKAQCGAKKARVSEVSHQWGGRKTRIKEACRTRNERHSTHRPRTRQAASAYRRGALSAEDAQR